MSTGYQSSSSATRGTHLGNLHLVHDEATEPSQGAIVLSGDGDTVLRSRGAHLVELLHHDLQLLKGQGALTDGGLAAKPTE